VKDKRRSCGPECQPVRNSPASDIGDARDAGDRERA